MLHTDLRCEGTPASGSEAVFERTSAGAKVDEPYESLFFVEVERVPTKLAMDQLIAVMQLLATGHCSSCESEE